MNKELTDEIMGKLTTTQIEDMTHALGLSRQKKPYRNYYNDNENKNWDDLVSKGLAKKYSVTHYAGKFMYCVSDKGFELIQKNSKIFNLDKRYCKMPVKNLRDKFEI